VSALQVLLQHRSDLHRTLGLRNAQA
jgi:hypothetical protein